MNPDVYSFMVVMFIIIASIACLAGISVLVLRAFNRSKLPQSLPPKNYDERFAQLQQSIDSIAVEVERIAEGQRFSTKLLAESARGTVLTEGR
ncbi:MAG: hypothetical protein ABI229_08725 [Gemmatimonadaceae bacterium]